MPSGFQDLNTIIPERPRAESRIGYLTRTDFRNGRILYDPDYVTAIEGNLRSSNLCLIVGPRSRGKTVLAKTIGLRFLQNKFGHVRYGALAAIDVAQAVEEIIANSEHSADRFLFIVEDCHLEVSAAFRLIEAIANIALGSAGVLLTCRPVAEFVLDSRPNVMSDMDDQGLAVWIRPGFRFVERLIRDAMPADVEQSIHDATSRFAPAKDGSVDLAVVAATVNHAIATRRAIGSITSADLHKHVVELKLSHGESRDVLLRLAAIAQFDVGVASPYAECGSRQSVAEKLVEDGVLTRVVSEADSAIYYYLDDPAEAEILLAAGGHFRLLDGLGLRDYVLARVVEYLAKRPPNADFALTGARAQFGKEFVQALATPSTAIVCGEAMAHLPLRGAATILKILRGADISAARTALKRCQEVAGENLVAHFNSADLHDLIMFLSAASKVSPGSLIMEATLDVPRLAEQIDPSALPDVEILSWISENIRPLWEAILASGKLTPATLANHLRARPLQKTMWSIRALNEGGLGVTPKELIEEMGGAAWALDSFRQAPLSVIGTFLTSLRECCRSTYLELLRALDFPVLAEAALRGGASGLHNFLPSVPLHCREKLLREIAREGWVQIVERSTLASIANMLVDLTYLPRRKAVSGIAVDVASSDLSKPLRSARIGIVGRFLSSLQALAPGLCKAAGKQVAGLDQSALLDATLMEPATQRLERLGLLLKNLKAIDRESAQQLASCASLVGRDDVLRSSSMKSTQLFLYELLELEAAIAGEWVDGVSDLDLLGKDPIPLAEAVWLIWNVAQVRHARAMALLTAVLQRQFDSPNALIYQLALVGLGEVCGVPVAITFPYSSAAAADAINNSSSPGLRCLSVCALGAPPFREEGPSVLKFLDVGRINDDLRWVEKSVGIALASRLNLLVHPKLISNKEA
jgi:hypothetical protein